MDAMKLHAQEEYPEGAQKEGRGTTHKEDHKTCGNATNRVAMDLPQKDPCPSCGCPAYWATIYEPEKLICPDCRPWPSIALVAVKHAIVIHDGVCYLDEPYYRQTARQGHERGVERTTPGRPKQPASGSKPSPQKSLFESGYYL